jgi:hypothetical protein
VIRLIDTKSDELLTREQAAALLHVTPHTLACWRSAGRGPAIVKFSAGRSAAVRYRRSEIERWIADPVAADAAAREPWREARRKAIAARGREPAAKPAKRRARSRVKAR